MGDMIHNLACKNTLKRSLCLHYGQLYQFHLSLRLAQPFVTKLSLLTITVTLYNLA